MAYSFPLFIDLEDNNCVIIGGGDYAANCAHILLKFHAKITVISPHLCDSLRDLEKAQKIRYIPRKYYRGDCSTACLCIAATDNESINISISVECKAKGVPVNISKPAAFGNFSFPSVILHDGISIAVSGEGSSQSEDEICERIKGVLPNFLKVDK